MRYSEYAASPVLTARYRTLLDATPVPEVLASDQPVPVPIEIVGTPLEVATRARSNELPTLALLKAASVRVAVGSVRVPALVEV
jgi:hypothetical protein